MGLPPLPPFPYDASGVTLKQPASLWAKLFGNSNAVKYGLLSQGQANDMGKRSLLQAGLAMMAASSPQPVRPSLGGILNQGFQAGQGAFDQGLGQNIQLQDLAKKRALEAQRQQILSQAGPQSGESIQQTADRLQRLAGQVASVDPELAQHLAATAKSIMPDQTPGQFIQSGRYAFNPYTGQKVELPIDEAAAAEHKREFEARLAESAARRRESEANAAKINADRDAVRGDRLAQQFTRRPEVSKMLGYSQSYDRLKADLEQARAGNPAAYGSTLIAFAGAVDPNVQMRQGIINKLEVLDPSVKGRADVAIQKLTEGRYPLYILEALQRVADAVHQKHADTYERLRSAFNKRNPDVGDRILSTQETFGVGSGENPLLK